MEPIIDLTGDDDEVQDQQLIESPAAQSEPSPSQPFFVDLTRESVESLMREAALMIDPSAKDPAEPSASENQALPFRDPRMHSVDENVRRRLEPLNNGSTGTLSSSGSLSAVAAPAVQQDARFSFSRLIAKVNGTSVLYGVVLTSFMKVGVFNPDMSNLGAGLHGVFLRRSGGHINNTTVQVLDAPTNQVIGFVERTASVSLCRLLNDNIAFKQLQISAGIDLTFMPQNWHQVTNIHLCILIYGPAQLRGGLHQIIQNHGLILRQPEELDAIYARGNFSNASMYQNYTVASQKTITQDLAKKQVEEIFASIKETDMLPEVEPAPYIKTNLSPHQKMALFFMKSRECAHDHQFSSSSAVDNSFMLKSLNEAFWKRRDMNGLVRYHNVLTDSVADNLPNEPKGGILADDMGLGKTLTTLSLIFSDFDKAQEMSDKTSRKSHATLVICPLSLISNWKDEIVKHIDGDEVNYRIYTHHGSQRTDSVEWLMRQDMVITTYHTLASDFKRKKPKKRKIIIVDDTDDEVETDEEIEAAVGSASSSSVLHKIKWHRIVLDEAHFIKEHKTALAKAVFELDGGSKWCLSGTPLQNKLDDLFSLLKFLDVEPFSDLKWWNENVSRARSGAHGMKTLQTLMKIITLRRTKDQLIKGKPIVDIPPRKDSVWYIELSENEKPLYDIVFARSKELFKEYDGTAEEAGTHSNSLYGKIFEVLLRLRQICAHSGLVRKADTIHKLVAAALAKDGYQIQGYSADEEAKESDEVNYEEIYKVLKESGDDNCCACGKDFGVADSLEEESVQANMSSCLHLFCDACVRSHKSGSLSCPSCGVPVKSSTIVGKKQKSGSGNSHETEGLEVILPKDNKYAPLKRKEPSSKVKALIADLLRLKPQGIKSVVFSQWTQYLDILAIHCQNAGIKSVKFDGSMNMQARANVLTQFKSSSSGIDVLLISLKAGGVGLNLNEASRVYIMDPWWNPSVESQAIDRIHRMGQRKQVETIRIVAQDTIEERIVQLQEKKSELAKEALMDKRSDKEVKKMKAEDLRMLFSE